MQQVIRLEHPSDCQGPYRYLHDVKNLDIGSVITAGYTPMFGGPASSESAPRGFKYGFTSVKQAEDWWCENARVEAVDEGYVVGVYEVQETLQGYLQVAFDPALAKLVAHIPAREWVEGRLNLQLQALGWTDADE